MNKIFNWFLCFLKMLLLLISFVLTFYIIVNMYNRLEKDMIGAIYNFIPFVLLFILFAINLIFKQKKVIECTFYNITCCLVFIMILFSVYRTFFDRNMVAMIRLGYDINFNYFADMIAPIKAMLYILCLSNVLLIFIGIDFNKIKKHEIKDDTLKVKKDDKLLDEFIEKMPLPADSNASLE